MIDTKTCAYENLVVPFFILTHEFDTVSVYSSRRQGRRPLSFKSSFRILIIQVKRFCELRSDLMPGSMKSVYELVERVVDLH